jgi:hypothetical protein
LQGSVTSSVVEQEGDGVREDLPKQPAGQVPEVLSPYPLYGVASRKLAKDSVDTVAKAAQIGALLWDGVPFLGGVRSKEFGAHSRQLFLGLGRVVIALPDHDAVDTLDDLRHDGKLVDVGRGYREASDEPRPTESHVHPEAVEGLLEEDVFAESGLSSEAATPVGTSEQTSRQGKRVADGEGWVVGSESEELLPEALLEFPEVGRLPSEGGAMDLEKCREPFAVVPSEVVIECLVSVETEELADRFDGEDLGVRELGRRATLTNAAILEVVVDETEDGDDEGVKIHERRPPLCSVLLG